MEAMVKILALQHAEVVVEKGNLVFTEGFLKNHPGLLEYLEATHKTKNVFGDCLVVGESAELYEILVDILEHYVPDALIV